MNKLDILRILNSKTGYFWKKLGKKSEEQYKKTELTNFKQNIINQHYGGRIPKTPLELSALWQMYNKIKKYEPKLLNIKESLIGNPYQVEFEGNKYSFDWLQTMEEYISITEVFGKKIDSILEIGGGFGRIGEFFLKQNKKFIYNDVDIEPGRSIAKEYLVGENFENRINMISPEEDWNFRVDLAINIDSFQEMSQQQVKDYVKMIYLLQPKYVYFKNSVCPSHNLINFNNFILKEYPKKFFGKPIIERIGSVYPDMIEQFWDLSKKRTFIKI